MYYDESALREALKSFKNNKPFDHCLVDNFLLPEIAKAIEKEFLDYESPKWFCYKNALEDKKALNDWNAFPALTYRIFRELVSEHFMQILSQNIGVSLYQDPGLHGGGWHIHGSGGNLNPHHDYSIHPKINLQRKVNIIIYLSSDLIEEHGGHLGFWSHDFEKNQPDELVKIIQPAFNRAVIFDTTQNSWHGICRPLNQPEHIFRKSIAVYYLTDPPQNADPRQRALYAPRENQKDNDQVKALIKKRADSSAYFSAYKDDT